jgi:hypothetical protein
MVSDFYFDESGHSGDLTKTGASFDFLDQPFFVLAAVGLAEASSIANELATLRIAHNVPSGELKSKSLQGKPEFVAAVFEVILKHELPLFIEVVDKKYFVGVNIVAWLLMPPVMGLPEGPSKHYIQNTLAQLLYEEAPNHVLDSFIEACLAPSEHTLANAFSGLNKFAAGAPKEASNRDFMTGLRRSVEHAIVEYDSLRREQDAAFSHFLPPPDVNPRGKNVWMLPNLTSFTNIYARINMFRRRQMSGVRLVHDEQLEVGEILRIGKASVEQMRDSEFRPFTPNADYVLDGGATLHFEASHDRLGIQIADVIAGAVMRYYRARLRAPHEIHPAIDRAAHSVLRRNNVSTGWGLNLVGPDELLG